MRRRVVITIVTCGLILAGVQRLALFPQMDSLDFCFENDFLDLETGDSPYSLILGNSRSLSALHGPTLSHHYRENFLHLGYSSSDLVTAHLTLAYALKQNPSLVRVVVEISPFHFDSRRVNSPGIRHYFFQKEPFLLIDHGKSLNDLSDIFPKSSTFGQLKGTFVKREKRSDYSTRWDCNSHFQRNESNWAKAFDDRHLQFETEQIQALRGIQSICTKLEIPLAVIFAPTDTLFQRYFENYWEYQTVVKRNIDDATTVLDFDNGQYLDHLMDADHIGCPERFTTEVVLPNL